MSEQELMHHEDAPVSELWTDLNAKWQSINQQVELWKMQAPSVKLVSQEIVEKIKAIEAELQAPGSDNPQIDHGESAYTTALKDELSSLGAHLFEMKTRLEYFSDLENQLVVIRDQVEALLSSEQLVKLSDFENVDHEQGIQKE
ncbi:MAG: hypothetical protein WC773_00985 [Patescibacteria group bacterium]|jgi:hypothetical protein